MPDLNFNAVFEVKFITDTGVFEGYASVFNIVDKVNDKIVYGAFKDSLKEYKQRGDLPPLLWQHSTSDPIGMWTEMYEDEHGLFVKGKLFVDEIKTAQEAYKLLQENVVTGLSIGYRVVDYYTDDKNVRILTKVDLQEVSLVTFPANDYARVSNINGAANQNIVPTERELEAILRNSGLSRRQAKGVIACGYKSLVDGDDRDLFELADYINRLAEDIKKPSLKI